MPLISETKAGISQLEIHHKPQGAILGKEARRALLKVSKGSSIYQKVSVEAHSDGGKFP